MRKLRLANHKYFIKFTQLVNSEVGDQTQAAWPCTGTLNLNSHKGLSARWAREERILAGNRFWGPCEWCWQGGCGWIRAAAKCRAQKGFRQECFRVRTGSYTEPWTQHSSSGDDLFVNKGRLDQKTSVTIGFGATTPQDVSSILVESAPAMMSGACGWHWIKIWGGGWMDTYVCIIIVSL